MAHALDANTLALWRFNEASGAVAADETGNYPLTVVGPVPVVAGLTGNARRFGTGDSYSWHPLNSTFRTAMLGEWTVEAVVKRRIGNATFNYLCTCSGAFSNTGTAANNVLMGCGLWANGGMGQFWETGAGLDTLNNSQHPIVGAEVWEHVAYRKRSVGGSNYVVDYWCHGQLMASTTSIAGANNGTAGVLTVGRFHMSTNSGPIFADLDELRISNVARSDAEILASYESFFGSGVVDTTPPTVSLVSPVSGSPTALQPVVVDVTDVVGLGRVLVVARLASGAEEVVHTGTRFALGYTGDRTAITNGYRLSFVRRGGWPSDFVVDVYATDTAGLEA